MLPGLFPIPGIRPTLLAYHLLRQPLRISHDVRPVRVPVHCLFAPALL
jgi:hypothetical protein